MKATAQGGGGLGSRARPGRAARWLSEGALILLVCCVAGRCFVQELPLRSSALRGVLAPVLGAKSNQEPVASREELARATYAVLLLASGALAAAGAAAGGRRLSPCRVLAGLIALFAAAALVSALRAADKRSGLLVWVEQVALLVAAVTAGGLGRDPRRRRTLLAALLALGIAMAVKGLWQHFVEARENLEYLRAYASSRPAVAGAEEAERSAEMLEVRAMGREPTGYLGLANPMASLLIVLLAAAGGVAADAAAAGVRAWRHPRRPKGEVPPSVVAAGAAALAAAGILLTLLLTRSRAGIVSAAAGLAAAVGIARWGRTLARHWRKAVAAAFLAAGALAAGVVAYGLRHDSLPGKSLTFRWFYWTASAEVFREQPVWGVGGGNFPDAYLAHRRAEAEEAVKDPHNLVAHALTQFGLAGGLPYLAIVAGVLVGLARPGAAANPSGPMPGGGGPSSSAERGLDVKRTVLIALAVGAAVFLSRLLFGGLAMDAGLIVVEAVWPAMLLAAFLLLSLWIVGVAGAAQGGGGWTPLAVGVGAAAFVLHNLTEFSLWTPGVALVFWAAAGMGLSSAGEGENASAPEPAMESRRFPKILSIAAAVASLAAVIVVGVLLWAPVYRKTIYTQEAAQRWHAFDRAGAIAAAERAARADPLDDIVAADAARLIVAAGPAVGEAAALALERARQWSQTAILRDPRSSSNEQLAAAVEWRRATGTDRGAALAHIRRAIALDPAEERLQLEAARMLCEAGEFAECLRQLAAAEEIDRRRIEFGLRFPPPSKFVFRPGERAELEALRARAKAGLAATTRASL